MTSTTLVGRPLGAGASGTGNHLAELIWMRSLTGADRAYLEDARSDRSISFVGLRRSADRWATLLSDLGVDRGGTVGIAAAEPLDCAAVFLSVIASGRVAAPLDAGSPDRELVAACRRVAPAVVIADRPAPPGCPCEWIELAAGTLDLCETEEVTGGPRAAASALGATVAVAGFEFQRPPLPTAGPGGLVLSTSGTTGTPKLIFLSDAQLLHTAGWISHHHQLCVLDRGFSPLPLCHINAEVVGLLATLVAGASLVLDRRFVRRGFWELLGERRVSWLNAVPAILSRLAPLEPDEVVPASLRFVRSASAPLAPAVAGRFEQAAGVRVVETYGMTEAGSQITANPLSGPHKPGSVGRAVGAELRVVDRTEGRVGGGSVPPGVRGRVEIRGPGVIGTYAGPGYDDRIDAQGWLDTGDIGHLDEEGYLFLEGRVDDVINRGGEKFFPREVEEVVLDDPDVVAVAVVGWDHHELGRVPVAYLVARGVTGAADRARAQRIVGRLRDRCAESLSRAKRPVAFHVVERLPLGSTGKVRRDRIDPDVTIYSVLVR